MKPRPVRQSSLPAYPTRLEVRSDAGLLEGNLPPGWMQSSGALTVLLAAGLAGCGVTLDEEEGSFDAIAAPIFRHGSGRGATGCIVISPPVFLSEEEALQIIREELVLGGLDPSEKEVDLGEVQLRIRVSRWEEGVGGLGGRAENYYDDGRTPLRADLVDPARKVAVEYVSREDHRRLSVKDGYSSTVAAYDTKLIARRIREDVAEQGSSVYFGAFYDPLTGERDFESGAATANPAGESVELLRKQVRDFVTWLEGQGAI